MSKPTQLDSLDLQSGQVLLLDKPLDWTSFDLVNKIKWIIKSKVGHAGTLDPLATGLVIICTGRFTKKLGEFQAEDKEYTGTICLGATRPSYDKETEINATFPTEHITKELIEQTAESFLGDSEQMPPIFSAIKVGGKKSYDQARKGAKVELKPRPITIQEFEITGIEMPMVHFRIVCSKGTYIRSIAYDFGQRLNSGGYLEALRRTRSGNFHVDDAWDIDTLADYLIQNKAVILQHAGIQKGGRPSGI